MTSWTNIRILKEASKKLDKFLAHFGIEGKRPAWLEEDHSAKNWLLRKLSDWVLRIAQTGLREGPDGWMVYSPQGPVPLSGPVNSPFDIIEMPAYRRRNLEDLYQRFMLRELEKLQPYIDNGEQLGIDWNTLPLHTAGSDIVEKVRESKGPREWLAQFQVITPNVIRIDSPDAATLIYGAKKSTHESQDYGWCTGWFWQDHFEDYTRDGSQLFLVRTGPATEKRVLNGVEIPMAGNTSRDIFQVYYSNGDKSHEIRAPGNDDITRPEFEAILAHLTAAGLRNMVQDFRDAESDDAIVGYTYVPPVKDVYVAIPESEGFDLPLIEFVSEHEREVVEWCEQAVEEYGSAYTIYWVTGVKMEGDDIPDSPDDWQYDSYGKVDTIRPPVNEYIVAVSRSDNETIVDYRPGNNPYGLVDDILFEPEDRAELWNQGGVEIYTYFMGPRDVPGKAEPVETVHLGSVGFNRTQPGLWLVWNTFVRELSFLVRVHENGSVEELQQGLPDVLKETMTRLEQQQRTSNDYDGVEVREPRTGARAVDAWTWQDDDGLFRIDRKIAQMAWSSFARPTNMIIASYRAEQDIRRLLGRGRSWAVLSAAHHESPEDDAARFERLESSLDQLGVAFRPMQGEWEGVREGPDGQELLGPDGRPISIIEPELSFLVEDIEYDDVLVLAREMDQEAFIFGHEDGTVSMYFLDGRVIPAGDGSNAYIGEDAVEVGQQGIDIKFDWDHEVEHEPLSGPLTREQIETSYAARVAA